MNRHLHGLKLRALVRDHLASSGGSTHEAIESEPVDIGIGAALSVADQAWILIEERHERCLGIGLAWMQRCGASSLNILTSESAGSIAQRAEQFALGISVWEVRERSLVRAEPAVHRREPEPTAEHLAFGPVILESGADLVIEHGVVSGEVLGLEVCRVVDDGLSGQSRLEVGVGAHDREAFALMHGQTPTADSLRRIVDVVRRHRRPGADPHPLNRLAAERSLRARVIADPRLIGAGDLRPVSGATPRPNVKDPIPCAAIGVSPDGENVIAVFSTGIDLDVVPAAAEIRAWHCHHNSRLHDARLTIVVPERDASPVTQRLAETLREPARVVGITSV